MLMKEVGMDGSQANENELQKAIDDITSGAVATQASASNEVAAELETKIQNQMGTPPAPSVPADGAMPEMAMPTMPTNPVDAMNPVPAESPAIVGSGAPVVAEGAADDVPADTIETPETEVQTTAEAPAEVAAEMGETAVKSAVPSIAEVNNELGLVKQAMLRDLFPLMDKVELAPEQKYDVYKEMIESTGDRNMIPAAYEVVKEIADDTAKAEALLYLVDKAE